jgi:hypothetical protein
MIAPQVTLPTYMSLMDWADQVALDLDPYGALRRLNDETDWQNWAMQFLNNTSLKENFPVPYHFTDWREWAERFCQVLL